MEGRRAPTIAEAERDWTQRRDGWKAGSGPTGPGWLPWAAEPDGRTPDGDQGGGRRRGGGRAGAPGPPPPEWARGAGGACRHGSGGARAGRRGVRGSRLREPTGAAAPGPPAGGGPGYAAAFTPAA